MSEREDLVEYMIRKTAHHSNELMELLKQNDVPCDVPTMLALLYTAALAASAHQFFPDERTFLGACAIMWREVEENRQKMPFKMDA